MKHILIAVIGSTPQVLTETFWALRVERGIPIGEIFVFTTTKGKETCQQRLFEEGRFARLLTDYGIPADDVAFTPDHILVFEDAHGNPLEDIRTSEENRLARDVIFAWVEEQTRDDQVALHGSLAGGRKSMGFLMGAAIQFFGRPQDQLYHVLVHPYQVENSISFYYPTPLPEPIVIENRETKTRQQLSIDGQDITSADVRIELAEMPFISVREIAAFGTRGYDEIRAKTQEAIRDYPRLKREHAQLLQASGNPGDLVGQSRAMRKIHAQIAQAAQADVDVLIQGETGTGKEKVARAIYETGPRRNKPFIPVNCGALSETLLESTLFGAVKGAYTGQAGARKGVFEAANGGMVFLDEIGELSPKGQLDLLRVLQERKVMPLGSNHEVDVDVRIIAATNRDLKDIVAQGAFREDLFYRLHIMPISVPPLRVRSEDIPDLIHTFCQKFNAKHNRNVIGMDGDALAALRQYAWPGNVRQLENLIERMVISAPPGAFRIHLSDLPDELRAALQNPAPDDVPMSGTLKEQLVRFETRLIRNALDQNAGVIAWAARTLGVDRSTLSRKIKEHGLK